VSIAALSGMASHGSGRSGAAGAAYIATVRSWIVIALAAALAGVALAVREGNPREVGTRVPAALLGVDRGSLVRLDPRTLEPLDGRRVRLREPVERWAREPGGSGLAVVTRRGARLRFVDTARMRAIGDLDTGARGLVAALAWPRRDRLWLVLAAPACCATGTTTVVTVDPVRREVVSRRELPAGLARAAATPDGAVLLLAPSTTIGTASLATVDDTGAVNGLRLAGTSAGLLPTEGVPFILRTRQPGLAVDAQRRRAYVVSSRPQLLEVDLRALRVRYHRLSPYRSPLDRLRDLLEPPADAQQPVGPTRVAAWLPPGLIAVSGHDSHVSWRPRGGVDHVARPAGLRLIDTRRWDVRTLDERAASFRTAEGLIVTDGRGLAIHGPDGTVRVLEGRRVELLGSAASLAYVRDGPRLHVVDLTSGRIEATSAAGWPQLLLEPTAGPWE
jgi:hypothetical protein